MKKLKKLGASKIIPGTEFKVKDVRAFAGACYKKLVEDKVVELSVDNIAYTEDYDVLYSMVSGKYPGVSKNDVFRMLMGTRKSSRKRVVEAV